MSGNKKFNICKEDIKFIVISLFLSLIFYLLCGKGSYFSAIHYNHYYVSLPRLPLMSMPVSMVFRAYDEYKKGNNIGWLEWLKVMNKCYMYSLIQFLIIYFITMNTDYGVHNLTAFPATFIIINIVVAMFYVILVLVKQVRVSLLVSLTFSICCALYTAFEIERFDLLNYFYGYIATYPDIGFVLWCVKGMVIVVLLYGVVIGKKMKKGM